MYIMMAVSGALRATCVTFNPVMSEERVEHGIFFKPFQDAVNRGFVHLIAQTPN
jgi:hypothetical protein